MPHLEGQAYYRQVIEPRRCPACGRIIPWRWTLCNKCWRKYGKDRGAWPGWLRWLALDIQREINHARRHDDWQEPYDETGYVADRRYWLDAAGGRHTSAIDVE